MRLTPVLRRLPGRRTLPGYQTVSEISRSKLRPWRRALERELAAVLADVSDFIKGIKDEYLQLVFRLRFIRCLSWAEVAAVVGGRNSEESVKSACYRYLEKLAPL